MVRLPASALLALLPLSGLCSAATLSLDEALAIALSNNTAVTNAELQREAAEDDVAALRTSRYPRLDLGGGVSHNMEDEEYTFDEGVWGDYSNIGHALPH